LLRERGIEAFLDAWEAQPLFATQTSVAPARLAARRARRLALDPEQLARSLETMGLAEMPDYRSALIASDAGLVVGAEDTKFVEIASGFPNTMRFTIDACGHDAPLEYPAALATIIRAFVR
jgi:pimeloyl-ACP methyl ester carboxylesterase